MRFISYFYSLLLLCYLSCSVCLAVDPLSKPKTTIQYPASENIFLTKTLVDFYIADTSGLLYFPDQLVFDGSILFNYGQWNSTGLPLIFRSFTFRYTGMQGNVIASDETTGCTNAYPFVNGFALIQKGNHYNFINRQGQLIGPTWFDYAETFYDGLAIVGQGNWGKGLFVGKIGFIDSTQRLIIPMNFESAATFVNGVSRVWFKGKTLQINKAGKPLQQNNSGSVIDNSINLYSNSNASMRVLPRPEEKDIMSYTFQSAYDTLVPIATRSEWEYRQRKGAVWLKVNYEYVLKFSEGFAPVKKSGKWNLIDEKNNLLCSDWFDDVEPFRQGVARVSLNGKTGYMGRNGKYILPLIYPVRYFSGGNACIETTTPHGKDVSYIDKKGKSIIPWMNEATNFVNGKSEITRDDGMLATINTSGNILENWHYRVLFKGDRIDVLECNGLYTLRDKAGRMVYNWSQDVDIFHENLLAISRDSLWGFVDKYGKTVIKLQYSECWDFKDGLALVKKDKLFTWIDKNGRNIANDWFEGVGQFDWNLAPVMKKRKWGYLNTKGELSIKLQYEAAAQFIDGFALVKKSGKYGYIKKDGKKLTNCEYTSGGNFSGGIALVKKGKISGYINRSGSFTVREK